jgi:beta-N-acetylhexosaminidase
VRRRRVAIAALGGLAAGSFVLGAALGDGPAPRANAASALSPPQLAGERVVAGFPGTAIPPALTASIREGRMAGVILFADNLPTRSAGRRLIARLQAIHRPPGLRDPLLIMVDQEGGLVKRIGGSPTASARQMGARGAAFSREQGRRTARNLSDMGINVNLAPVLDVARPGGTIDSTDRAFGATAQRVAETAIPFARALQQGGVAATAKHFPGLGTARVDTDFAVQRIDLPAWALRAVDEAPYRPFFGAGGEMVMLSTAIYPAFSERPAAFARSIATEELRNRLGFQGVSITDALETVSVGAFGGPAKAGLAAARAGVDLLLFTHFDAAARAQRALARRLRDGTMERTEFERSAQRVLDLRGGLASPAR